MGLIGSAKRNRNDGAGRIEKTSDQGRQRNLCKCRGWGEMGSGAERTFIVIMLTVVRCLLALMMVSGRP